MKKKAIYYCLFVFSILSCVDKPVERVSGNLHGMIGIYEGNCMPSPGNPPCNPSPFSTMVLITKPAEHYSQNLVIDSVRSDANGQYSIYLPAGKYSLFLRDGNEIVCDSWFSDGQNTYCMPFEIRKDSVTFMDANIDHAAW